MKSFCIKTNSEIKENYLIGEIEKIVLPNIYISSYQFKIYKNIIVHYTGEEVERFCWNLSLAICNTIEKFYEEQLLNKIISKNYFYFDEEEKETISRISYKILLASRGKDNYSNEILKRLIYEYVLENKKMILERICNI